MCYSEYRQSQSNNYLNVADRVSVPTIQIKVSIHVYDWWLSIVPLVIYFSGGAVQRTCPLSSEFRPVSTMPDMNKVVGPTRIRLTRTLPLIRLKYTLRENNTLGTDLLLTTSCNIRNWGY